MRLFGSFGPSVTSWMLLYKPWKVSVRESPVSVVDVLLELPTDQPPRQLGNVAECHLLLVSESLQQ